MARRRTRWILLLLIVACPSAATRAADPERASAPLAEDRAALDARGLELQGAFAETLRLFDRTSPEHQEAVQQGIPLGRLLFKLNLLTPEDRYALLRTWTLPGPGHATIRQFNEFLGDFPPPAVFQNPLLPPVEEPLVSSLTMLIDAARETDRLDQLASEAETLAAAEVEGAEVLWLLIEMQRGHAAAAAPRLKKLIDSLPDALGLAPLTVNRYAEGPLICEAIRHSETRHAGTLLDKIYLAYSQSTGDFSSIAWHYRLASLATIARTKGADLQPSADPGLRHWVAVDLDSAPQTSSFGGRTWWVGLDDRIGHISSPWIDHLVFAYPLQGTFEVSGEAFNGMWSEGNIGFGGLMFEAWNQGSGQMGIYPLNHHEGVARAKPVETLNDFNPLTIRVQPDRMQVLDRNEQVLFENDGVTPSSPFFVLRTTWLSAFRNLKITGHPAIPREISLLAGNRMDGWITSFYQESQPSVLTPGPAPELDVYDWATIDGVLHGRQFPGKKPGNRLSAFDHDESWAYFHRPLREGERIRYEFFHQPGEERVEVHPTMDRIAFLLHPEGIKLHWLTTNRTMNDPHGWIATDNIAEEPARRRGSNPLPLRVGDWNAVVVGIREGQVQISLNDQLIYERPLEQGWGTRFGLYHDRSTSSARVRNIVLSGDDWPEWSPELASHLFERREPLSAANVEAIRLMLNRRLTTDSSPSDPSL